MKYLRFFTIGILFGIIMTKSEAISWFRIQEMFRFESFHMYGIIGTAVVLGAMATFIIKNVELNNLSGKPILFASKQKGWKRYLGGGTIFGLGWAMTGACPGPLFTLLGHGLVSVLVIIISATVGTYFYGLLRERLPH